VDDIMFAHNRLGKGDANRAYTQSDLQGDSTEEKSDVYDRPVNRTPRCV